MVLLIFSDEKKKQEMINEDGVPMPISNCSGEWHYPRHCSSINGTCEYSIQWTYKGRKVIFYIEINLIYRVSKKCWIIHKLKILEIISKFFLQKLLLWLC